MQEVKTYSKRLTLICNFFETSFLSMETQLGIVCLILGWVLAIGLGRGKKAYLRGHLCMLLGRKKIKLGPEKPYDQRQEL